MIVYYRDAIKLRPQTPAVYNNLGLALFVKYWLDDNPDQWGMGALESFRQALRIDPAFAPASNNLGYALKSKGDWDGAKRHYQSALQDDAELAPAHANLAEIQAGGGQFDQALDHYRASLRLDPDFALAQRGLGLVLETKPYLDEANECYPEGVKALDQFRGSALNDALARYQQALRLDPKWAPVPNVFQIPSKDQSLLDEAIDHFRQAIRTEPQMAIAHGALGQALLVKRSLREAETSTQHSLDLLQPPDKDLRRNVESLLQRCKRLLALEIRLPAIVQGKEKSASSECLDVAELCFVKRHYAAAAAPLCRGFCDQAGIGRRSSCRQSVECRLCRGPGRLRSR